MPTRAVMRVVTAAFIAATLFACPSQTSASATWSQDDFQLSEWGVAQGLPGNHVASVAQDRDGFLWLATMAGLARFDGVAFRVYNERDGGLPTSRFNALDAGPSGRLWIGSERGHLIVLEDGRFRLVAAPPDESIPIGSIAEDVDGSVWFTRSLAGVQPPTLLHWDGAEAVTREDVEARLRPYPRDRDYTALDKPGGPMTLENDFPQMIVARDGRGAVWARSWPGSSMRVSDGLADPFGPGDASVLMLGSAEIMARLAGDTVELLSLEDGTRVGALPRDPERLRGVWLRDRRGLLWVTGPTSLAAHGPGAPEPIARWELGSQVLDLDEDREGNLWVATRTRGLLRIRPNPVRQLGAEDGVGLPSHVTPRPDGSAVMRLQILRPGPRGPEPETYLRITAQSPTPRHDPDVNVLVDRLGTRWDYGSERPIGTRADGSRAWLERACFWIYADPREDDALWTFSATELYRFRSHPHRDPEVDAAWPMRAQTAPLFDADGSLWIGSTSGLHHVRRGELRSFDRDDGLPVNDVRALHRDADGGLWVGTYGGGLAHFDGSRFRAVDQRHGLADDAISSILPDRHGALWLGSNRGIQRLLLRDLHALLEGESGSVPAMLFDAAWDLDNPEATGPHSAAAVGEYLYFATFAGLVRVDPARVAERERQPPMLHLLDDEGWALRPDIADYVLENGQRSVAFAFAGLHLSAPDTLRYRYRLDGHDADWIDAGPVRQARYDRLAPADYRFLLQARHSGGPWVDASAQPRVEVAPQWWETTLARWMAVLGLALLLLAGWRLANRQLRRRAEALEALVAERTADLKVERDQVAQQAVRLEQLAEGRARFMSGISHELRTPLSLVLAPLADLDEGRHGELPGAARAQLGGVRRNAERLLRLVERLLEVARVEAGVQTLHCVAVDLRAAVETLVDQLLPLAQQRGSRLMTVLPTAPVPAWVDLLLMESVLVNLVVNALRHTPAGSTVTVELAPPPEAADGTIVVCVRDDGPGIPDDALPHLFERFFRARGEHDGGQDGFGLGLPLVREVVERHGGRVAVDSSPQGSCFTVTLRAGRAHLTEADLATSPLAPARMPSLLSALHAGEDAGEDGAPGTAPAPGSDAGDDRKMVLVVDDHAELRRLVRSYLEPEFRVEEADTGASALDRVAAGLPDLIVSDLMMPTMDGHEFCRRLRADPDIDFIPLLMLTAKAGLEHRIGGLEGGADAYLGKPFDRRELLATVHSLLAARRRLQQHLQRQARSASAGATNAQATGQAGSAHDTRFATRLRRTIDAHLADEDFGVDALAEAMAQDRSTLYRSARAEFGKSPSELLREARLLRAQSLLQRNEGSVSEVAYAVGFRNLAHFSTSFRQRFGHPPSRVDRVDGPRAPPR